MKLSIIICCHNSEERLPSALRAVDTQYIGPGDKCELVIVNNASGDRTALIAGALWGRADISLIVVDEPLPGLSHARRCGVAAASGDIILFCDDDNLLAPDYVSIVSAIFSTHSDVGAVGGCGKAVAAIKFPVWFTSQQAVYACGPQACSSGFVPLLYGAGLAIRRTAWESIMLAGFPALLSDRKGNTLSSGGDSELCLGLRMVGWKLWYDSSLRFQHVMPQGRLTESYLLSLHFGVGSSHPVISEYMRALALARSSCASALVPVWVHALAAHVRAAGAMVRTRFPKGLEPKIRSARLRGLAAGYRWHAMHEGLAQLRRKIRGFHSAGRAISPFRP